MGNALPAGYRYTPPAYSDFLRSRPQGFEQEPDVRVIDRRIAPENIGRHVVDAPIFLYDIVPNSNDQGEV